MKKIIITISAALCLVACSKKTEDFIGVHNFKIMNDYMVIDTSETVNSIYGTSPLVLHTKRLISFTLDYFQSGEELKGTLTITELQTKNQSGFTNEPNTTKIDLKNIHLVNDTLVSEITGRKKPTVLKLVKLDGVIKLVVQDNETKGAKEVSNKLSEVKDGNITYTGLNSTEVEIELIKASNSNAVDKSVEDYLKNGYRIEKKEYLKNVLSNGI